MDFSGIFTLIKSAFELAKQYQNAEMTSKPFENPR